MIIVKNRELLIPENERYIGTNYDSRSENRQFKINRFLQEGTDLSALTFRLDITYPDRNKDTVILDRDVHDDHIILTWNIASAQLAQPGTQYIQLRATDENLEVRWSSFMAQVYVERHMNAAGSYTGDLSELEQMEAQFDAFYSAELRRQENESARQENETTRVEAETARETAFTDAINAFNRDREDLEGMADVARSWAVGGTGTREGEDVDNAKYYAETVEWQSPKSYSYYDEWNETIYLTLADGEVVPDTEVYRMKGSVANWEGLPSTRVVGDVYNVESEFTLNGQTYPAGTNVVWTGTDWDPLAGVQNLDSYMQEGDMSALTNAEISDLLS